MQDILKYLTVLFAHWWIPMPIGVIFIGVLAILAKHKQQAQWVEQALEISKGVLGQKLGTRADAIFDVMLRGMDSIQDGNFTQEEAVQQLINFVRISFGLNITAQEEDAIKEASTKMLIALSEHAVAPPTTAKAFKIMSSRS